MRARERDYLIASFENVPRTRHDLHARRSERHALGLAFDELYPQILLEFFQLRRQGRLAHETTLGGAAEVPGVRHRDEIAQILQFHIGHRRSARFRISINAIILIAWTNASLKLIMRAVT